MPLTNLSGILFYNKSSREIPSRGELNIPPTTKPSRAIPSRGELNIPPTTKPSREIPSRGKTLLHRKSEKLLDAELLLQTLGC
jgi:hypothetical protein